MVPSQATPSTTLSATIKDLESYPKYVKRTAVSSSANINANIDNLVKTGKLTQEQANLVIKGCNRNSMFGTLLDAFQNSDSDDSTDNGLTSIDPASILLDAFKANDKTEKTDSPLYDTLAAFMPTNDLPALKALTEAKKTSLFESF